MTSESGSFVMDNSWTDDTCDSVWLHTFSLQLFKTPELIITFSTSWRHTCFNAVLTVRQLIHAWARLIPKFKAVWRVWALSETRPGILNMRKITVTHLFVQFLKHTYTLKKRTQLKLKEWEGERSNIWRGGHGVRGGERIRGGEGTRGGGRENQRWGHGVKSVERFRGGERTRGGARTKGAGRNINKLLTKTE